MYICSGFFFFLHIFLFYIIICLFYKFFVPGYLFLQTVPSFANAGIHPNTLKHSSGEACEIKKADHSTQQNIYRLLGGLYLYASPSCNISQILFQHSPDQHITCKSVANLSHYAYNYCFLIEHRLEVLHFF